MFTVNAIRGQCSRGVESSLLSNSKALRKGDLMKGVIGVRLKLPPAEQHVAKPVTTLHNAIRDSPIRRRESGLRVLYIVLIASPTS